MHVIIDVVGIKIGGYGLMIVIGIFAANALAAVVLRRYSMKMDDFIVLEGYGLLGAFIGAKALYFVVTPDAIDWSRITDAAYISSIMESGFVFYGGLIGGILAVFLAGKIHRIQWKRYLQHCICVIPVLHGFGRLGCFMAGCCYGVPYVGPLAVEFPANSFAPSGVSLFPVQLVEAISLFALAAVIIALDKKEPTLRPVYTYLGLYGVIRFGIEYLRFDGERGEFLWFSTSQWISIAILLAAIGLIVVEKRKEKE